jgi:hypothetical protein
VAIFSAFQQIWSTDRDDVARAFFAELELRLPSVDEFMHMMQPGSDEFITFDRTLCAYDQAGTLIKNAVLHPVLFFESWRSPAAIWGVAGSWVRAFRETRNVPHLYDNSSFR